MYAKLLILLTVFLCSVVEGVNSKYYVDATHGNDSSDGLSRETAWQSLLRINSTIFGAGDTILLKTNCAWNGILSPLGSGSEGLPNVIDTFGGGSRPIINANGANYALFLSNQEYWEISHLELTNDDDFNTGNTSASRIGIFVTANNGLTMNHLQINNCYIHNVDGNADGDKNTGGIVFAASDNSRYHDVLIDENTIRNVDRTGMTISRGAIPYSTSVIVRNNSLHNIGGDGILMHSCRAALVEYNFLDSSCARSTQAVAGIWPWKCDSTVFQFNESCRAVGPGADRNGFDCDYWCTATVMQYNYSHDNAGGFMLICSPGDAVTQRNYHSVIRYNISQNDRKDIFTLMGPGTRFTEIYNNTIYVAPGVSARAVWDFSWNGKAGETYFRNNIFNIMNGDLFQVGSDNNPSVNSKFVYEYNCYYGIINSLDASAILEDPMFVSPGSAAMGRVSTDGYKLQAASPCVRAGKLISNNGGRDYWGNTISATLSPNIGADGFNYQEPEESIPVSMVISARTVIKVPESGFAIHRCTVLIKDQYDRVMHNRNVQWSLEPADIGVSIDVDSGILSVDKSTQTGYARIIATDNVLADTFLVLFTSQYYKYSEDFSAIQGYRQWYYKYMKDGALYNMVWDSSIARWKGDETYLLLGQNAWHPGTYGDVVLDWIAPNTGKIRIMGIVKKADITCGDGINVSIKHNSSTVWGQNSILYNDGTGLNHDIWLSVSAGDSVRFVLGKRSTNSCDGTRWDPIVYYDADTLKTLSENYKEQPESLIGVYPNPFNPVIAISINGWKKGGKLLIMDIKGAVVGDLTHDISMNTNNMGIGSVVWNAVNHASGAYVIAFYDAGSIRRRLITLIK
jgi:hypothetical protein